MQNAFKYMDQLKQKGYTHEQAEGFVSVMFESMNDNLATKSDLEILSLKIDNKFLQSDQKIANLNSSLTVRIGVISGIYAGLVVGLLSVILR